MDLVTKNLLESFRKEQSFSDGISQPDLFEYFANFCVTANEYEEEFEIENISVAGGNDLQLDGVVILVNGVLINSKEEIDELAKMNKYVEAEFIFIQAKSGSEFKGSEISDMFFGIKELLSSNPSMPRNELLSEKESYIKYIYTKSDLFKHGNPKIKVYYVTTGKWTDEEKLVSRIKTEVDDLEDLAIFDVVLFKPIDARGLQGLFSKAKNNLSKTFVFSNRITLPQIDLIRESYLGYVSATEYISLISDENGNLIRTLFTENVRDFQGDNPVNTEIDTTLKTEGKEAFVVLNNGVTIVSEDLKLTGDKFTLTGYQIVNGCQTSHVLFNNKDILNETVQIPLKLIVAPDNSIKNRVTKATNRQTPVKIEELSALTDFQKHLEEFYMAVDEKHKLFYERRSQQFRSDVGIEKIRIVNVSSQIRSFAAMFLKRAHQSSRYYGTLIKDVGSRVFVEGHPPIAYYLSSYTLFRVEWFMRRNQIDNKYRAFKYHLLDLIRMQILGTTLFDMKSNKFEKSCERLNRIVWDDDECLLAIQNSIVLLDSVLNGDLSRDNAKDSNISDKALKILNGN
ncbi:AIPR family protein [Paenibacillus sp. S29]|uniref:AIPR family protein n=1 Tax=Paenibacillus sp. S29 TaxID=3394611 RepID=UPI0039BEF54A